MTLSLDQRIETDPKIAGRKPLDYCYASKGQRIAEF